MTECRYEREVISAMKSNQWIESLRIHVAGCPLCQETMNMTRVMETISGEHSAHALPSYQLIWLKAQYAKKEERISLLDIIALSGMSLAGIAGFIGLLLWRFPNIFNGIIDSSHQHLPDISAVFSNGAPVAVIIGLIITVWVLTRDSFFAER